MCGYVCALYLWYHQHIHHWISESPEREITCWKCKIIKAIFSFPLEETLGNKFYSVLHNSIYRYINYELANDCRLQ